MTTLDDLLDTLADIRTDNLRYEIRELRAVRNWAVAQQTVRSGDLAVIRKTFPPIDRSSGWWPYREALRAGALVKVTAVEFATHSGTWRAMIHPTPCWSASECPASAGGTRYPKSDATFSVAIGHLRPARPGDRQLVMPTGPVTE